MKADVRVYALLLIFCALGLFQVADNSPKGEPAVVAYSAEFPEIQCLQGRVIAESAPTLTAAERRELWGDFGLRCSFEWVVPQSGFTYHELEVQPYSWFDRQLAGLTNRPLPPRELPQLIAAMNEDPRLNWAAPDALMLEWAAGSRADYAALSKAVASIDEPYGASFIDEQYRVLPGGLEQWKQIEMATDPMPDFEYYRLCNPDGNKVQWDLSLWDDPDFRKRCETVYGTGQGEMLELYEKNGSPALNTVTVCVADTGILMNHPDLSGRLHPNAIDSNYSNYAIAQPIDRVLHDETVSNRGDRRAIGLPREAIQGRPASHGTCVAGIVARCTHGFKNSSGADAVRILPASIKSERSYAITGVRVKSPISAFIKFVACMYQEYPTLEGKGNSKSGKTINDGDVRVISTSASIPRSYFSGKQWRIVKPLAQKMGTAIAEDLRNNDRVWVFASGNDKQQEPGMPADQPFVLAVTACMPYDPAKPWESPASKEAANLGEKCVAAPGYGMITSTLYDCPNLAYLPSTEIRQPVANFSVPPRRTDWVAHTNMFSATSGATPQVSALAALIYARKQAATYSGVINRIELSCGERRIDANYGKSKGLIDYRVGLGFD
jgi:Subtilase family